MSRMATALVACALAIALAACSSTDTSAGTTSAPGTAEAPAPPPSFGGPTSDSGSRYVDPSSPLGGVVVETPPTAGTYTPEGWPVGATSIARPAGTPAPRAPTPDSGSLPPPAMSPPPPPPPPSR